jgi:hypothetical protein
VDELVGFADADEALAGAACVDAASSSSALLAPPVNYCTAGTSTFGCNGLMSVFQGSGQCVMVASQFNGQAQSILFYGISGRVANPWSGTSTSFMCVKAPRQQTPLQISGGTFGQCDGTATIDLLAFIAANSANLGNGFVGGEVIQAQCWYRDPPAPKTTNLTNAVEFTF